MKIGLKLWPDKLDLIDKFRELFDFFEILAEPDFDVRLLKKYDVPITIHAAHVVFGFNPCNPKMYDNCKKILAKAIEAADAVNSKWIIVHPGYGNNPDAKEVMLDFLKHNFDKRFVFENCPSPDLNFRNDVYQFSTPGEMKQLLKKFNTKMCLDFGHAIVTANNLGKDPNKFIQDFFKLKPKCFHLIGTDIDSKIDTHKHLFEVNNDFDFLKQIKKFQFVTLETGEKGMRIRENHVKDIELIKSKLENNV